MFSISIVCLALCIDAFVASFALGADKVKIPFRYCLLINIMGCLFLSFSLFIGSVVLKNIDPYFAKLLSFTLFTCLGIYCLFESSVKNLISKKLRSNTLTTSTLHLSNFKLLGFKFALSIFLDSTTADIDKSKTLSFKESIYTSFTLSIDSLVTGFASGLIIHNHSLAIFIYFVLGSLLVVLANFLGLKISHKVNIKLSWLTGILLIALGIIKLL